METDTQTLALAEGEQPKKEKSSLQLARFGDQGIQLNDFPTAYRFAEMIVGTPFCPKGFETAPAVMLAIQFGMELGFTPMMALQNVAVINGRPGLYGDAQLAKVRSSGKCEKYSQRLEGEGDARRAVVTSKRVGEADEMTTYFSVADAKKAGLWGKGGPWSQYPDRMLVFRARSFNLRDNFGDILRGVKDEFELADTQEPTPIPKAAIASVVEHPKQLEQRPAEKPRQTKAAPKVVEKAPEAAPAVAGVAVVAAPASPAPSKPAEPVQEAEPAAPAEDSKAGKVRELLKTSGFTEEKLIKVCIRNNWCETTITSIDQIAEPKLDLLIEDWGTVEDELKAK